MNCIQAVTWITALRTAFVYSLVSCFTLLLLHIPGEIILALSMSGVVQVTGAQPQEATEVAGRCWVVQ